MIAANFSADVTGVRVGLPRQLALTLVAQTALGAARMVLASGRHPASLRDDVTTPAGCTIAGLLMLEDGRIRSVLAVPLGVGANVFGIIYADSPLSDNRFSEDHLKVLTTLASVAAIRVENARLTEEQIVQLIAYLRSIGSNPGSAPAPTGVPAGPP